MLVNSLTANCVVLCIVHLAVDTSIPHCHAGSSADTLPLCCLPVMVSTSVFVSSWMSVFGSKVTDMSPRIFWILLIF